MMERTMMTRRLLTAAVMLALCGASSESKWCIVPAAALESGPHHTRHAELYGAYAPAFNLNVLKACDIVQATAMDGGGYFVGVKANPPESPIGYDLKLFGKPMLAAPRKTSYCSGASYTAFIEALNVEFQSDGAAKISNQRLEAMRMQEPDGGRREDGVKFWGLWNDDGPGSHEAAIQYAKMADEIKPIDARPGDFMNINWTSGVGHSVVFLGWHLDKDGNKCVRYWSSQKGTNGLGDQSSLLSKVKDVKIIRITHPENVFTFDPLTPVQRKGIAYDKVEW
jgi:hypothetical protein